ncbi:50S ribosomal protein L29 [Oceanotoga sp. DSM 15011]|jgi:large subunit ribosomal protein L29|uniref:Large ribosomal subunit protein uL29 n=1 Tax=Oceanotoga teriensis TaxID=515440 RepID=A0AA45C622_9BACT|nr:MULTISPECIES: 50S ribosomal protein L29 [Oceanotoga]MDN5343349.1 large subunit ribosomal protein [Oceanotoga sp.]MDO7975640.1 50S ribosomal protein L29 [Oceanotoga teriensis]PWJ90611.1 LSU ribosomal protein L29P [Oceanotoga teriensis]UYO99854.1 50S ribosomal protein L29 [Oceanotoga sp. DSM 15011]
MKASEFKNLTDQELTLKFEETKKKLFELRFQLEMGQLKNTATIKQVKKDIARIKTILRERELGIRR